MASIGEYAISVKADAREFQKGMEQVAVTTQRTTAAIIQTTTQTTALANGTRSATFAVQSLAIGLQDAASVFGTTGFSGAIRAAGNNVIQFASLLSPLAGTIAAVGLTGVQLLTDYFTKQSDATKAAAAGVDKYTEAFSRLLKTVGQAEKIREIGEAQEVGGAKQTRKELEDRTRTQQAENAAIENRIRDLATQKATIESEIAARIKREEAAMAGTGMEPSGLGSTLGERQRLDDIAKERAKLEQELGKRQGDSQQTQAELVAAREREQQLRFKKQAVQAAEEAEMVAKEYDKEFRKFDEDRMKRAIEIEQAAADARESKEKSRQQLIAQSRRDEMQENERRTKEMRAVPQQFQYAGYGSAAATEALSRSRSTYADDAKNFQDKSIGIQENMLDQLVELNRQQKEANVDVVEDLLLGGT